MRRNQRFLWRKTLQHHFRVDECPPPERRTRIDFDELRDHDLLRLEMANARYQVRILRSDSRYVLVQGGPAFGKWTLARLQGTADSKSAACRQEIHTGRPVVFSLKKGTVVTGPVRSMEVCR